MEIRTKTCSAMGLVRERCLIPTHLAKNVSLRSYFGSAELDLGVRSAVSKVRYYGSNRLWCPLLKAMSITEFFQSFLTLEIRMTMSFTLPSLRHGRAFSSLSG